MCAQKILQGPLFKKTMAYFLILGCAYFSFLTPAFSSFSGNNAVSTFSLTNKSNFILQTSPSGKATIGILLLYQRNGENYVLLGREREDAAPGKAGTFSDLGGKTQKGTFLENALRELKEESAGVFNFFSPSHQKRILEKSLVISKNNPQSGRKIVYLLYPLEPENFKSSATLDSARKRLQKDPTTPPSYLEKDLYVWVDLKDLCAFSVHNRTTQEESPIVHTLEGQVRRITLRPFFIKDFLKHPSFKKMCSCPFFFKNFF